MNWAHPARLLIGILAAASIVGCAKDPEPLVEVTGTVRLERKPLNKALVIFSPVDKNGPRQPARGVTDEKGQYRLTTNDDPGAAPGEYVVTVMESEFPAELRGRDVPADKLAHYLRSLGGRPLPQQYADQFKTPLRANVTAEKRTFNFNLQRD
jgi:hypothetical protein